MAKPSGKNDGKNGSKTSKAKPAPRESATAGDDTEITALKLPPVPLSPEMATYFA
jgi:hypothetical protein